ncbi:MAG: hypothetical protein JW864_00225 [Spirochaetes bacterium]|nr:hypothetical protein [Spirochaetota bacterium]
MTITKAERVAYNNYVKEHHEGIEQARNAIKDITNKIKTMSSIKGYLNIEAILDYIKIIRLYIKMNDISLDMLDQKNETYLNNARKEIYKVLQLAEEIVGSDIDRSLKENEEYLKKIDKVNPLQIINLLNLIQNMILMLIKRMGEGSKWKWSFVDMQGRIAVIMKNFINFSDIQKYRDPRTEFFRERQDLLKLCKKNLGIAAQQFRTRYEVSTQVPADMLKSIELLSSLRKINVLTGESEEATRLKNTIDALRERLESDEKKKDSKKKKKKKT